MPERQFGIFRSVLQPELASVAQRLRHAEECEGVALLDLLVVGLVREREREDTEVNEVLPVDAGDLLRDHHP